MWLLVIIAVSTTKFVTVPAMSTAEFAGLTLCEEAKKELLTKSNVVKEAYCLKLDR
jgi:hypothetical protein